MDQRRGLLRALLGMAALAAFALVIVWLYKAHNTIPSSSAGAAASAPRATPTLPGPAEAAPAVVTATPLPSLTESPLATPSPIAQATPTAGAGDTDGPGTAAGYGDFPRVPVVAPSWNQQGLALYLVEGASATVIVDLKEYHADSAIVHSTVSPGGSYLVLHVLDGEEGTSSVHTVDLETGERWVIAGGGADGDDTGPAGNPWEITGAAWLDEDRLLFSRVSWPSAEAYDAYWNDGVPYVVSGELWSTDVRGSEQTRLASGDLYRVVAAGDDGRSVYVTQLVPEKWEWREESLAVLDVTSGGVRAAWPAREGAVGLYYGFTAATWRDGSRRIAFVTSRGEMTSATVPPQVWLGDPDGGTAELMWTADESRAGGASDRSYVIPTQLMWSPETPDRLAVLARDGVQLGLWVVDRQTDEALRILDVEADAEGYASAELVAWTDRGIVMRDWARIRLLSEEGEVLGEIRLTDAAPSRASSADAKADWPVPLVHQIYDVPEWFNGGWACGPTSMVMVLAYMGRLARNPITVSHGQPAHTTDFGYYTAEAYTQRCGCTGSDDTFDEARPAKTGPWGAGAYGQIMEQDSEATYRSCQTPGRAAPCCGPTAIRQGSLRL